MYSDVMQEMQETQRNVFGLLPFFMHLFGAVITRGTGSERYTLRLSGLGTMRF